ncbi:MAG: methyl-accepting chemotaxis protein [Treponema sp.]|jgi:methyl-accepting chemotaxis protein|nr:methyl-accepting chemotaxis protein [Treponema sp.]
MQQIVRKNVAQELTLLLETSRLKLESSVNSEITIVLKMAGSPLIQRYFLHPEDPGLEQLAFDEIAGYRSAFKGNTLFWISDKDKRFYSDDAYAYTLDPSNPAEYWYNMTLYETERFNFNINYNDSLKKTFLWINAPVFSQGKATGIVGTGIELTAFIDSLYEDVSGDVSLYLFNRQGEITGAPDDQLLIDKVSLAQHLGTAGGAIFSQSERLGDAQIASFTSGPQEIAVGRLPLLDWYITALEPITFIHYLQSSVTLVFFVMLLVILLVFFIINLYIQRIFKPLGTMIEMLKDISEGEGDLTKRLTIHAADEIGNMGTHFNETLSKIHNLVVNIKQQSVSLANIGTELSTNMAKTAMTIGEIDDTVKNVKQQANRQAGSVNQTSETMRKIIASIEQLNQHIETQAGHITQSSAAIKQMLANIASVTKTLVMNNDNVRKLSQASDAGRTGLQEVSTDIQEIAKESEGLLEITAVMDGIASQTNLLSMNAAIEAAHAGESGKGFAVVADEIRKLAESSGEQSNTIASVLKKIKGSIDKIALSTNAVIERFEAIDRNVKVVSEQEEEVRKAMEEQGTGSKQILEYIGKLNDISQIIKEDSEEMRTGSREILAESKNLEGLTGDIDQGMEGMASGADQINTAVQRVHDLSGENKRHIDVLVNEISKFKVEGAN